MVQLSDEAREARNAYYRQWRRDHPERDKEHKAKYWEVRARRAGREQSEGASDGKR